MEPHATVALALGVLLVAFLYSAVGHAGASGYIAVMALAGLSPAAIKPAALVLNIVVATIGTWQFHRAGHFDWRFFRPFALLSIPAAFLGGWLRLPTHAFKLVLGAVLVYAAIALLVRPHRDEARRAPSPAIALATGAALGFLSGLVGVGGGIFLTPLLILAGWARTRQAAATSAAFILVNSISGLAGALARSPSLPPVTLPLVAAVAVGGGCGSYLGSRHFPPALIKRLLAAVLAIAAAKMLFA